MHASVLLCLVCPALIRATSPLSEPVPLTVGVLHAAPFVIVHTNDTTGEHRFTGHLIDWFDGFAAKNNMSHTYVLEESGKYGVLDADTKEWTGLVGSVHSKKIDVALAPLTVTPKRLEAIKFTRPLTTKAGVVAVSLLPRAGNARRFNRLSEIFEWEEQPKVGVIGMGSTYQFFMESKHPLYKAIGERIVAGGENSKLSGMEDAGEKLRNKTLDVVFLEEMMAEYLAYKKPCDLYFDPHVIAQRQYGIGVHPDNEALLSSLNKHVLHLQATGEANLLTDKWWSAVRQCPTIKWCVCDKGISSEEKSGEDQRLRPNECGDSSATETSSGDDGTEGSGESREQ